MVDQFLIFKTVLNSSAYTQEMIQNTLALLELS